MWPSEQNLALQCFPVTQRAVQKWLCWKNYSQGHNCNEVLSQTYNIIKISNSTHVNSHPTWLEADLVFGLGKCRQLFTLADHRGKGGNEMPQYRVPWPHCLFCGPREKDRQGEDQISSEKEQKVRAPLLTPSLTDTTNPGKVCSRSSSPLTHSQVCVCSQKLSRCPSGFLLQVFAYKAGCWFTEQTGTY